MPCIQAVQVADRLRLSNRVAGRIARAQTIEGIVATRIREDVHSHRIAHGVGAGHRHRHAADAEFQCLLSAVVIRIHEHRPGDRAAQLAEVVVRVVFTRPDDDGGDRIWTAAASRDDRSAARLKPVVVARRLRLRHCVAGCIALLQIGESVASE